MGEDGQHPGVVPGEGAVWREGQDSYVSHGAQMRETAVPVLRGQSLAFVVEMGMSGKEAAVKKIGFVNFDMSIRGGGQQVLCNIANALAAEETDAKCAKDAGRKCTKETSGKCADRANTRKCPSHASG